MSLPRFFSARSLQSSASLTLFFHMCKLVGDVFSKNCQSYVVSAGHLPIISMMFCSNCCTAVSMTFVILLQLFHHFPPELFHIIESKTHGIDVTRRSITQSSKNCQLSAELVRFDFFDMLQLYFFPLDTEYPAKEVIHFQLKLILYCPIYLVSHSNCRCYLDTVPTEPLVAHT